MTRPIDPTTDGDAVGYLRHQAFLSSQNGRERALSDKCADYLRDMVKLVNKQIEYIRQLESDYAAKCDELRAMASVGEVESIVKTLSEVQFDEPRPSEACRCGRLGAVGYVPCPVHDRECASGGHRASKGVSQADYGLTCIESQSELDESAHVLGLTNSRRCPNEARLCGVYLGDNDGTCPQLTCIRGKGHGGAHDNVRGDPEIHEGPRPDNPESDAAFWQDQCRQHDHMGYLRGRREMAAELARKALGDARPETAVPVIDQVREIILDKVAALTRSFSADDPWIQAMLCVLEAIDERWPPVTGGTGNG
jgi:hypothetical protein